MSGTTRLTRHALLLGSTLAWPLAPALAQTAAEPAPVQVAAAEEGGLAEIVVTASKRSESLQNVPISIQALGTEKLDQLQAKGFDDYVRFLPSVTFVTGGPGTARVYFRGVSAGENGNHSSSQPTVGIYLDEQPITTIGGALDIHLYDIARVEALAGPQGTLYGSSSEAGTIRIITNKPDPTKFSGAVDLEVNKVTDGGWGYVGEGFLNVPLSEKIAVRAVGWYDRDAGFIDNIAQSRTFTLPQYDEDTGEQLPNDPSNDITVNNARFAKKNYNDVKTYGGRIALGIELDDNWTVTPSIMGQKQSSDGFFGQESGLRKRQVAQYNAETYKDDWYQAALTIEGKLGDWSLTYSGAYLKRNIDQQADYSDYSYFYDALAGSGNYITDNVGNIIDSTQRTVSNPRYTKQSHEIRITSPSDKSLRLIAGAFYQRQRNGIEEHYIIDNLADDLSVPGTVDNIWLTKQTRVDRDYAVFGELAYDILPNLTVTGGARLYKYDNSLVGFFGYGAGLSGSTGESQCFAPAIVKGSPCTNLDRRTKDTDWLPKVNLTWKVTDDALVYATYSKGFRPGGINRRGTLDPYAPDTLENYELGFKTSWADNRVRFNGAIYQEDWKDVQSASLGENGLTIIRNAGNARIRGFEFDLGWAPVTGLTLSAGGSYNDAKLTTNFCAFPDAGQACVVPGPPTEDEPDGQANSILAPDGTRLPRTPKFKGNALARYEFEPVSGYDAFVQGAVVYEGRRTSDLRTIEKEILGKFPAYTTVDFSVGVRTERFSAELYTTNVFDVNGKTSRSVQCPETTCGGDPTLGAGVPGSVGVFYTYVIRPRTVGLKFGTKF